MSFPTNSFIPFLFGMPFKNLQCLLSTYFKLKLKLRVIIGLQVVLMWLAAWKSSPQSPCNVHRNLFEQWQVYPFIWVVQYRELDRCCVVDFSQDRASFFSFFFPLPAWFRCFGKRNKEKNKLVCVSTVSRFQVSPLGTTSHSFHRVKRSLLRICVCDFMRAVFCHHHCILNCKPCIGIYVLRRPFAWSPMLIEKLSVITRGFIFSPLSDCKHTKKCLPI